MEIYSYLTDSVKQYAERKCFEKEELTYLQVLDLVLGRAAFLQKAGFGKNDIIGLLAVNSGDWLITFLAIVITGAQALLLNTNSSKDSNCRVLKELSVKVYFSDEQNILKTTEVKNYQIKKNVNILNAAEFQEVVINEQDIALLAAVAENTKDQLKIVPLSHFNVVQAAVNTAQRLGPRYAEKIIYGLLPLSQLYGLIIAGLAPLFAGSSLVFQSSLKTKEIVTDLKKYQVNVFPAVPAVWEFFLEQLAKKYQEAGKKQRLAFFIKYCSWLRKLGLARVVDKIFAPVREVFGGAITLMISSGTVLRKEYEKAYRNMGFPLIAAYGSAETGGFFAINDPQRFVKYSAGQPLNGNEIQIRNAGSDRIGEIWLKGATVFKGYYENKKLTEAVFDDDGWFSSGDRGFLNKKGVLYIS